VLLGIPGGARFVQRSGGRARRRGPAACGEGQVPRQEGQGRCGEGGQAVRRVLVNGLPRLLEERKNWRVVSYVADFCLGEGYREVERERKDVRRKGTQER